MINKRDAKTLVNWVATNGIAVYAIYAGIYESSEGWANIATAIIVTMFAFSVLLFLSQNQEVVLKAYVENHNPVIPTIVTTWFDLAVAGVLIYNSWFWVAGMYLFSTFTFRVISENAKEYTLRQLKS